MKRFLFLALLISGLFVGCTNDDDEPVSPRPDIVVPDSLKVNISGGNLYYKEIQVGASQLYWVDLEEEKQYAHDSCITWYADGVEIGNGAEVRFTPSVSGKYTIRYTVVGAYSVNGNELTGTVKLKAYSSRGILILNEPNMTGSEQCRGINSYLFGENVVNRFIVGNNETFGATNQFLANWAGNLYNVAPYKSAKVAFSKFKEDGTFIKAMSEFSGQNRAFAGIDEETGVLTTANNAWLVNLKEFTIETNPLTGSVKASNVFVTDGYVFLIADNKALAYKVDSLSAGADSIVLGKATAGFVQSKDGKVWAANGKEFLCINPRNLQVEVIPIPDGGQVKFSSSPWKQCSFVASSKENALFFTNDGGWGTASSVYKYDIDRKTLDKEFVTKDKIENYMLYATSIYYDVEKNWLVCSGIKNYGSDSAYNGLFFFDAGTGEKKSQVLYETDPASKDMWFPAMMVPMKN